MDAAAAFIISFSLCMGESACCILKGYFRPRGRAYKNETKGDASPSNFLNELFGEKRMGKRDCFPFFFSDRPLNEF